MLIIQLISYFAFGQNVEISQDKLEDLSLCNGTILTIKLKNTSPAETGPVELMGRFPSGLLYIQGSVLGAAEGNISNFSNPKFNLPSIPQGDSTSISLQVKPGCGLYDQVNQGALFTNQWFAISASGLDSINSAPFSIYTGFLVLGNVPSERKETGSSFERKIAITNSRLGSIQSFIFEDRHGPLSISSLNGNTMENSDTLLRLSMGPSDFVQIGDRDSLFETGETIYIFENIAHMACTTELIQSSFRVQWGCDLITCQEYRESSQIEFIQPLRAASLQYEVKPEFPECICDPRGALQEFNIINTGGAIADSVMFTFKASQALSSFDAGFLTDSIYVVGGKILNISFSNPVTGASCYFDSAYHEFKVTLDKIDPGQRVSLFFRYVSCRNSQPELATNFPWFYSFSYNSVCIPNSERRGNNRQVNNFSKAASIKVQLNLSPLDSRLIDGRNYTATANFMLDKPVSDKNLIIQYNIPCPLKLADTAFLLLGKHPISKEISVNPPYVVLLEYAPPFPASFSQTFTLTPDCMHPCLKDSDFSEIDLISTCPYDRDIRADMLLKICAKASLSCQNTSLTCGPVSLNDPPFELNCLVRSERKDTVPAYIIFEDSLYRINKGLADPDDNRFADLGSGDLSRAKIKNFITGDTIAFEFRGRIFTDIPLDLDSVAILIGSDLSYNYLHSRIRIVKKSSGELIEFNYPETDTFRSVNPLPNCTNPVIQSNPLGKGILIPLTPERIRAYYPNLSNGFRFEEGDSIYCVTLGKISSFTEQRIATLPILTRMAVNSRNKVYNYPYSCIVGIDTIKLTSLGLIWTNPQPYQFICSDEITISAQSIQLTGNLDNYFSHEYRTLIKADSLYFTGLDGVQFTGIEVELYYRSGGNRILHKRDTIATRQIGSNLYSGYPGALDSFVFDEAYELSVKILGRIQDCVQVGGSITTSLFCSGIDSTIFYIPPGFNTFYASTVFTSGASIEILNASKSITQSSKQIFAFGSEVNWGVQLSGQPISGDLTMELLSNKNSISNYRIQINPTLKIDSISPSTFRLNDIKTNTAYSISFTANTLSCDRDTLSIITSWSCNGATSQNILACTRDTFTIDIIPEDPELELDLSQQDLLNPLCDTIPTIKALLYNADRGNAVDVYLEVQLPPGIFFIPGQQFYRYPINASDKLLPPPNEIAAGVYRWYISELDSILRKTGLKGIYAAPENSIGFSLLTATDCNSTVNGSVKITAGGNNNCGIPQNVVSRSGPRIRIQGADLIREATLEILQSASTCADSTELLIKIEPNYRTSLSDSLEITIPPPLSYIPFSFIELSNFGLHDPVLVQSPLGQKIIVALNENSDVGDLIEFRFRLSGIQLMECGARELEAILFFSGSVPCKASGGNCQVKQQIKSNRLSIVRELPDAKLLDFKIEESADPKKSTLNFVISLKNTKSHILSELCLAWVLDLDASGDWSLGDSLADVIKIDSDEIRQDGNHLFTLERSIPGLISCGHLLAILPKNCLCSADTISYKIRNSKALIYQDSLCPGRNIELGKPAINPYKYKWIAGSVGCDSCSILEFMAGNSSDSIEMFRFIMTEGTDSTCQNTYEYLISVFPKSKGNKSILEECPGAMVHLDANGKENFIWIGDRIQDPLQSNQSLVADDSLLVLLQFSDQYNCPVVDSFCIWPKLIKTNLSVSNDTTVAKGSKVVLCAYGGISFEWMSEEELSCPECPCIEIVAEKTQTYTVLILDSLGCPHTLDVTVFVTVPECLPENVFLPNAFSPNGDGKNDVLYVLTNQAELDIHLVIYNRWGERVFETRSTSIGWNGEYNGSFLPPDVYGYQLTTRCPGGKEHFRKGNISLLK